MKYFFKVLLLSFIFLLFFTSCDTFSQKAGTFSVKFSWEKDSEGKDIRPDISSGDFYVTVRIYEWAQGVDFPGDISAHGRQLLQSDPAQMKEKGTNIKFEKLSYGKRRFVTAEIRKGRDMTGGILFTGMSQLFDLNVGKHTEVNVQMNLTPTPGVDEDGNRIDAELRIVDDNGNLRGYTNGDNLNVKLRLLNTVSFTKVFIANKEEFIKTEKGKEYQISDLIKLEDDNSYEIKDEWDLSFELTADEIAVLPELKVYARVENEYGQGLLLMAKIALDNDPPELTLGINPAYTNGSQTITLGISANELIRHNTLNIQTSNDKLKFDCPVPTKNESLSFTCTIETLDEDIADGDYEITVTASDQAGNSSKETKTTLTIDRESPELTFTVYKNSEEAQGAIYLKEDDEFEVNLVLSKEPSAIPVVRLGSSSLDCTKTDDLKYSCMATIKPSTHSEGISDLSVNYQDLAGNQFSGMIVSGIRLDYTPPEIVGDPSVSIIKPVGCPLSSVAAATSGSSMEITFTVNEILKEDSHPLVKAVSDGNIIEFGFAGQVGYFYLFAVDNITSPSKGSYDLEIEMTDEAGNYRKEIKTNAFNIKIAVPASPSVNTAGNIVYRRIPWGSKETDSVRYYSIKAKEGIPVVDERAVEIIVYDGPDKFIASEIGRTSVFEGTFSELELNRSDRSEVFIAVYDDACNSSETAKVLDVEWTATMGGKKRGSQLVNQHIYLSTPLFVNSLQQDNSKAKEPYQHIIENLSFKGSEPDKISREKTVRQWRKLSSEIKTNPLENKTGHSAAFNPATGTITVYGGELYGENASDTWAWSNIIKQWKKVGISIDSPVPRDDSQMVFDSLTGKIILFGGRGYAEEFGDSNYSDTWEWDGVNGLWTQFTPVIHPSGRYGHSMVYDSKRNKTVLFGGYNDSEGEFNDMWEWDSVFKEWTEVVYENEPPAERYFHAMAYDPDSDKIIMSGGVFGSENIIDDTWEWNISERKWTNVTGTNENPAARVLHKMFFDLVSRKTTMILGVNLDGLLDDMWEWNSSEQKWMEITLSDYKPTGKMFAEVVYDGTRNKALILGGMDYTTEYFGEMWEWDSQKRIWYNITPGQSNPSPRHGHSMVYDSLRSRTIMLLGGCYGFEGCRYSWEFQGDSGSWKDIDFEGESPENRWGHRVVYDNLRDKIILFGGEKGGHIYLGDTWELDVKTGLWTDITPQEAENSPSVRSDHAMIFDPEADKIILFGGVNLSETLNDTWEWNGEDKKWTKVSPEEGNPSDRSGSVMFYDDINKNILLFGGRTIESGTSNEIFKWNDVVKVWEEVEIEGDKPAPRFNTSMVFDNSRRRFLLFGGYSDTGRLNDTWEFDYEKRRWKEIHTINKPSKRSEFGMVYDSRLERVYLFGGMFHEMPTNDTWEWNGAANNIPANLMTVLFPSSGADFNKIVLKSLSSVFFAGGTGYPAPSCLPEKGAEMFVWNTGYKGGAWMQVAENTTGSDSADKLQFTTEDPDIIRNLFYGDEKSINIAVVPIHESGCGDETGEIAVDYAEVVVRYSITP